MKHLRILFLVFSLASFLASNAQEFPWEKYGFDPNIVTLSKGKYQEFHDLKTVVEIGSVLYNTHTKKIVGFVAKDTLYSEVDLKPHIISRWISPDPLSDEYSSWSPYNYTMNNPIIFIDPDGRFVSTHTDMDGNVVAVYNDGDDKVYRHKDLPDSYAATDSEKGDKLSGGKVMGRTLEWNSFLLDGESNKGVMGKINFNSTEAGTLVANNAYQLSKLSDGSPEGKQALLIDYAFNANNNEKYDIKSKGGNSVENQYRGSQLSKGVYVTARDAGNFLAGMAGRMAGLSEKTTLTGFGAFQLANNRKQYTTLYLSKASKLGYQGYFGEQQISHAFQKRGYRLNLK